MDHLYQIGNRFGDHPSEPMLEGYTTLSFLAGKTNKITLGLMVTGNVNPPGYANQNCYNLRCAFGRKSVFRNRNRVV